MNEKTDEMTGKVRSVLEAIELTKTERDFLLEKCNRQENELSRLNAENDMLASANSTLKAERDAYMRSCVELMTTLTNAQSLIGDGVSKARDIPYRSNGQIKRDVELTELENAVKYEQQIKEINQDKW